ncbi:MAG: ketoacyl-ACP synthase III [Fuerstiella sp.]|nr:ketoacyl-ACP synthase III [Fuerstiella sp.]
MDAQTTTAGVPASTGVEIDAETVCQNLTASTPAASNPESAFRTSSRTQKLHGISIRGIGSALPEDVVTNEDLKRNYGFDPEWIEKRTGIRERRRAAANDSTSSLAVRAAKAAISDAGISTTDIDLVVMGTFTPDYHCASSACLVQHELDLDAAAFDVQAACAGFMYALSTAGQYVATGNSQTALVIGADIMSRCAEPSDRTTAPLFGDGAGAVIVQAGGPEQGLLSYQLGADGRGADLLYCPVGGSARPPEPHTVAAGDHFLKMDGRKVFKWAVQTVADSIRVVLDHSGVSVDQVNLFVLHQANIRIIDHAMKDLGIPEHKVVNNLERVGNTSAASIPLVLSEANKAGRINSGDLVLMCGFGAGLTWGTGLFRW